jgi:hypothetical protein
LGAGSGGGWSLTSKGEVGISCCRFFRVHHESHGADLLDKEVV